MLRLQIEYQNHEKHKKTVERDQRAFRGLFTGRGPAQATHKWPSNQHDLFFKIKAFFAALTSGFTPITPNDWRPWYTSRITSLIIRSVQGNSYFKVQQSTRARWDLKPQIGDLFFRAQPRYCRLVWHINERGIRAQSPEEGNSSSFT